MNPILQVLDYIEIFLACEGVPVVKDLIHGKVEGSFQLYEGRRPLITLRLNRDAFDPAAQELVALAHETGHYLSYKSGGTWWTLADRIEKLRYKVRTEEQREVLSRLRAKTAFGEEVIAWKRGLELIKETGADLPTSFFDYFDGFRDACLATYLPVDLWKRRVDGFLLDDDPDKLRQRARTPQPIEYKPVDIYTMTYKFRIDF